MEHKPLTRSHILAIAEIQRPETIETSETSEGEKRKNRKNREKKEEIIKRLDEFLKKQT